MSTPETDHDRSIGETRALPRSVRGHVGRAVYTHATHGTQQYEVRYICRELTDFRRNSSSGSSSVVYYSYYIMVHIDIEAYGKCSIRVWKSNRNQTEVRLKLENTDKGIQ